MSITLDLAQPTQNHCSFPCSLFEAIPIPVEPHKTDPKIFSSLQLQKIEIFKLQIYQKWQRRWKSRKLRLKGEAKCKLPQLW